MKASAPLTTSFIVQSTAYLTDPRFSHFIPRATRKTLRLSPAKRKTTNTGGTDLTETFRRDAYKADAYHNANLYTQEFNDDEFGDIDDEYAGLTIVSPMGEAELFEFCTGYNVI